MSYSSQAGRLGLKTQASKGTYADPGATAPNQGVFMYTRSGSLGGNRDLLVPDPEIGGHRDIPDAQLGPINFPGEFDFYARMEELPTIVRGVLGGASTDGGSALLGYTHTIGTADTNPWLSVEEVIAGNYQQFKYTDVKVNTFHLEADANGYLMGTMGLIGLTQAPLTVPTPTISQRWDTSPLIVGSNIVFQYNGANLPAKSFSMDVNNNMEDDDFRIGSLFLGDLQEKRREITFGVTIRPQDATLWKTAVWGSPTATGPLGKSFKDDIQIVVTTYEDIPGATAGNVYTMTITLPQVIIAPFNLGPSGDDIMQHDLELRAVRPNPAVDIITVAIKNSFATVA
jgi:hypothetical protein